MADLSTDFDTSLPPVPCMVSEFNQVMLNLIVNARDAIVDGHEGDGNGQKLGKITIRTQRDDAWAVISVEDTGAGMSDAIKSRVFEPFFTTKEVGKGSGQGLAIGHSVIVDKHQGRFEVQSEVGKGTTFQIWLPLTGASRCANPSSPTEHEHDATAEL